MSLPEIFATIRLSPGTRRQIEIKEYQDFLSLLLEMKARYNPMSPAPRHIGSAVRLIGKGSVRMCRLIFVRIVISCELRAEVPQATCGMLQAYIPRF